MTPHEKIKKDFAGKKVLIFGLGVQGRGVEDAIFFHSLGARVHITDKKTPDQLQPSLRQLESFDFTYTLGDHLKENIEAADVIIRNASVPWNHPLLKLARSQDIPIKMDSALFFQYTHPKAVGVTGTRGKTTTANLIFEIAKAANKKVVLAGNAIPHASLPLIKTYQSDSLYIFELSSWQLQAFHQEHISPHIAILTNFYPDHLLDRSFDEYIQDKTAIFSYQSAHDHLIYNDQDKNIHNLIKSTPSYLHAFCSTDVPSDWKLKLKGDHNLQNIAAAIQASRVLNIEPYIVKKTITSFTTVPFRLQPIATINHTDIINDTTSTTPIATIKALQTYPQSVLILGGTTKHLPTQELVEAVNRHACAVILLSGTGTDEIKDHLHQDLIHGEYSDLRPAIDQAFALTQKLSASTLLFSPGFTSFGIFDNEFDRGRKFNSYVNKLSK